MGNQISRRAVAAGVCALGVAAVVGTVAYAAVRGTDGEVAVSSAAPGASPAACLVPEGEGGELWMDEDAWESAVGRLEAALTRRFGTVSKSAPHAQLAHGLIGRALDYGTEEFVVVADPAKVDLDVLARAMHRAADGDVAVRVQEGCHGSVELLDAGRVIESRRWSPDARRVSMSFDLDARTSTWDVTMPAGRAADALKARLRGLVTMHEGVPSRG